MLTHNSPEQFLTPLHNHYLIPNCVISFETQKEQIVNPFQSVPAHPNAKKYVTDMIPY